MKAIKGNKVYTIDEAQQKRYQKDGFDIHDEDGKIIAYGAGKTVTYEEHEKLLQAAVEAAKAPNPEIEALHLENEGLKSDLDNAQNLIKELQAAVEAASKNTAKK